MDVMKLLNEKRDEILTIASRHGASNVRVFGSAACGEAGPDNDVDFLVDVGEKTSSWFPAGLILDLEKVLGRRVAVVTARALNPLIRDHVLGEAILL